MKIIALLSYIGGEIGGRVANNLSCNWMFSQNDQLCHLCVNLCLNYANLDKIDKNFGFKLNID